MIASRAVLAGFVSALALAPALASDNSKSKIDPDVKVYGHPDQMSTSDQSSDSTSDNQQVAGVVGPPNPNDPNYVQELQAQLLQQQTALNQAKAVLSGLQAQLAAAQAALASLQNYSSSIYTTLNAAQTAYNAVRTNYINHSATYGQLIAAAQSLFAVGATYQLYVKDLANPPGSPTDSNGNPVNLPQYVYDTFGGVSLAEFAQFPDVNHTPINLAQALAEQTALLQNAINFAQVDVTRAQAAVDATTALITAAQNGQPAPGQTGDTGTDASDTANTSDPSNVAETSMDGGGGADSGGD